MRKRLAIDIFLRLPASRSDQMVAVFLDFAEGTVLILKFGTGEYEVAYAAIRTGMKFKGWVTRLRM